MFRLMVFIALAVVAYYLYQSRGPGASRPSPTTYQTPAPQNPLCLPPATLIDGRCEFRDASGRPLDGNPTILPPPPGPRPRGPVG